VNCPGWVNCEGTGSVHCYTHRVWWGPAGLLFTVCRCLLVLQIGVPGFGSSLFLADNAVSPLSCLVAAVHSPVRNKSRAASS
jgi:hypothetical protein